MNIRRRPGKGLPAFIPAIAAAGILFHAQPATSAETIDLTVVSGYPPAISWVKAFKETFMPAVEEELARTGNYTINWNEGFSGTIAKPRDELEAVAAGLGEFGLVGTVFHPDKLPLYNVPFVTPFSTKDMDVVANAYVKLEEDFPAFAEGWASHNQISLTPASVVDNYMLFTAKPVRQVADLKGMKIGAAGVNLPWVTAVGAAGVGSPLPDMYTSLETNLYEGVIMYGDAAGKFDLCRPAPYILDAGMGATNGYSLTVNSNVWQGLPGEVRDAVTSAAPAWREHVARIVSEGSAEQIAQCKSKHDAEITVLPDDQRKKWAAEMPNIAKEWATATDKKGLPGTEVLTAYMDILRAANQPIARHWDRE